MCECISCIRLNKVLAKANQWELETKEEREQEDIRLRYQHQIEENRLGGKEQVNVAE